MTDGKKEVRIKRDRWYYALDTETRREGPFTREELLEQLPFVDGPDTWVKGPGVLSWRRAKDIQILGLSDEQGDEQPNQAFWLTYLFFRPATFFRYFVIKPSPVLTVLCAWTYGVATVIGRMDMESIRSTEIPYGDTWESYWTYAALMGVIGGLFFFIIGGWWYTMRLSWSDAKGVDPSLARRVYLFASQVWAVPALMATLIETGKYSSPEAAATGEITFWHLLLLIFPFWSAWSSYVGVRTAFLVKRSKAMLWFLILPCLYYLLVFTAAMGTADLLAGKTAPDLDAPKTYQSNTFSFSYPGDWMVGRDDMAFDPDSSVFVEPVREDAVIHILLYESENNIEEDIEATTTKLKQHLPDMSRSSQFTKMGAFKGAGIEYTGTMNNRSYTVRIFISPLENNVVLETNEIVHDAVKSVILPGIELIRSTLKVDL